MLCDSHQGHLGVFSCVHRGEVGDMTRRASLVLCDGALMMRGQLGLLPDT